MQLEPISRKNNCLIKFKLVFLLVCCLILSKVFLRFVYCLCGILAAWHGADGCREDRRLHLAPPESILAAVGNASGGEKQLAPT